MDCSETAVLQLKYVNEEGGLYELKDLEAIGLKFLNSVWAQCVSKFKGGLSCLKGCSYKHWENSYSCLLAGLFTF